MAMIRSVRMHNRQTKFTFGALVATLIQHGLLWVLIVAAFIPFGLTILLSLRPTASIYVDFFKMPSPPTLINYQGAWVVLSGPIGRSILVCLASIAGILILASPTAYAFARLKFGGRSVAYRAIMVVLLVPSVILLTPLFSLTRQLGMTGSLWGLILYYIATGLPLSIFLLTPFLASQDDEIFQAARVDGAPETRILIQIALPLALPILITISILAFLNIYNDFIWPSLVLHQDNQTAMLALANFAPPTATGFAFRPDVGGETAGYVLTSVPQLLVLIAGMRYFIHGLTTGALK